MIGEFNSEVGAKSFLGFSDDEVEVGRKQLEAKIRELQIENSRLKERNGNTARLDDATLSTSLTASEVERTPTLISDSLYVGKLFQLERLVTSLTRDMGNMRVKYEEEKIALELEIRKLKNSFEQEVRVMAARHHQEVQTLKEEIITVKGRLETKQTTGAMVESDIESAWMEKMTTMREEIHVDLREIMEQQRKEQVEELRRETEREKAVIIFGVNETEEADEDVRQESEKRKVGNIIGGLSDQVRETEAWNNDVDVFYRVGRYTRDGKRPIRVQFKSRSAANNVLKHSWKLGREQEHRGVRIKQDLNKEKRGKIRKLIDEAKEKNENRTEEEKRNFFWWADTRKMEIVQRECTREGRQERGRIHNRNQQ